MFKVAIVGGESTGNYDLFKDKCIHLLRNKAKSGGITIYTTGDEYVNRFSNRYGIDVRIFYTDWGRNGKNALKERNEKILESCDAFILFDNGIKSDQILYSMAKDKGLPCRKITL
jgi:hypothetical protein